MTRISQSPDASAANPPKAYNEKSQATEGKAQAYNEKSQGTEVKAKAPKVMETIKEIVVKESEEQASQANADSQKSMAKSGRSGLAYDGLG